MSNGFDIKALPQGEFLMIKTLSQLEHPFDKLFNFILFHFSTLFLSSLYKSFNRSSVSPEFVML